MGRRLKEPEAKAISTTISVKPKHVKMIDKLCQSKKVNKSELIQHLLEKAMDEEPSNTTV